MEEWAISLAEDGHEHDEFSAVSQQQRDWLYIGRLREQRRRHKERRMEDRVVSW